MTEPQLLWEYQIQLRRIAEHRQRGIESSIRREYIQVLQKLQAIIAKYYAAYGNSDDSTMTQGDLRTAEQYKNFLQDVLDNLDGIAGPVDKQIRQTIEDTYTTCYNGMMNAVKQSTDNTQLGSLLSGLSSTTPETVKNIVENPMQKLTLSTVLSRRRNQIVKSTKKTLAVGLASGDSYTRMAQRIADTLNGDYKKAMRIVRTEANRAINRGFQDVTEEASEMLLGSDYVEVKEWCSAEDESVRNAHQHLNGKKLHSLDMFESSGAKADCPGSFGVAKEDINCRCFLMYSFMSRDEFIAQGGVIPDSVLQKEKELGLTSDGDGGIIESDKETSFRMFDNGDEVNDFFYYDDPNKKGVLQMRKGSYGKWYSGLSSDEKLCVSGYCAADYDTVNSFLRKNNGFEYIDKDFAEDMISNLDSAIEKFELRESVKTYRGANLDSILKLYPDAEKFSDLIGNIYHDKGYMSSSPLKSVAEKFATENGQDGVLFEIDVPNGSGLGAYVNQLAGQFQDDEYEFLIRRNTSLEIYDVDESGIIPILKCRWKK